MSQENQTPQEQQANDSKKYKATIKKIEAILGSNNIELPTKVAANEMSNLVAELFAEETKENIKRFKEHLREILKKHVLMKQEIAKKKKELEQLELSKQKEFVEASKKLFENIDGLNNLEKEYANSLSTAITGEVATE